MEQEEIRKINEEIVNAVNNNESWAADLLTIVSKYFIQESSITGIEGREKTEITIMPLLNRECQKYPIVKITMREKNKGDVEQKRSRWHEYTLYLKRENDIWQFIE
ncbi:MAG: hypothetical protein FWH36_02620 [Lentimicrobiaceae bacterium]|nr:hypothetical protein [Lentimicrobiaceae bacterium]